MRPDSALRELGLQPGLERLLIRFGVSTVGDLLALPIERLNTARRRGHGFVVEIIDATVDVATSFPELLEGLLPICLGRLAFDARTSPPFRDSLDSGLEQLPRAARDLLSAAGAHAPGCEYSGRLAIAQRIAETLTLPGSVLEALTKMSRRTLFPLVRAQLGLLERLSAGEHISIFDELSSLVLDQPDRNRDFIVRYLGFDGNPPETLEAIAAGAGLTRERVRQIVQRFRDLHLHPTLPLVESIAAVLDIEHRVMTLDDWFAAIPEQIRPEQPAQLRMIHRIESLDWLDHGHWSSVQGVTLVASGGWRSEEMEKREQEVRSWIRRANKECGLVGVVNVCMASQELGAPVAQLTEVLKGAGYDTTLQEGWLVRRGVRSSILARRALKMLRFLGPLSLDQMRRGLRRCTVPTDHTRPLPVPPSEVFEEHLRLVGFEISNGAVLVPSKAQFPSCPPTEAAILERLNGSLKVSTRHELVEAVDELVGFSAAALSLSPSTLSAGGKGWVRSVRAARARIQRVRSRGGAGQTRDSECSVAP